MSKQSTQSVSQRRDQFLASWREFAPEATFAKMSLEQYEAASLKPLEIRNRMIAARTLLGGMKLERDKADEEHNGLLTAIPQRRACGSPELRTGLAAVSVVGFRPEERAEAAEAASEA